MSKTYKNPPVIEAVCELRFSNDFLVNDEKVKVFHNKVKDELPVQRKGKRNEIELMVNQEKDEHQLNKRIYEFEQFFSEDEKYLVQLDLNKVSVHRLQPYTSWTNFQPLIEKVLAAHSELFPYESVSRVGLRYINHIQSEDNKFEEEFNLQIKLPEAVGGDTNACFLNIVRDLGGNGDALRIIIGNRPGPEKKSYGFDIDCFNEYNPPHKKDILEWLNNAHQRIENTFESILSDKIKEGFDSK